MRSTIVLLASLYVTAAAGHHSNAGLDMDSLVRVEGVVTEFNWRNPHVYFIVTTTNAAGEQVDWDIQMASTITVSRMGWTRDSLSIGDRVTLMAHGAIDGRPYGLLDSIEKEGGIVLPTSFDAVSAEPVLINSTTTVGATSLEGSWYADPSSFTSYPGGVDGFFSAQLQLTPAGRAAYDAYEELSEENPYASCIGSPTPTTVVLTNIYPLHIEINEDASTIVIRSELFDDERIVYMDGRAHPPADERTYGGHSIGRWDGDTLVVDTRNFADHRSPYQNGVPSGAQKHVVERYTRSADGTRVAVEFLLEDPQYLAAPLRHSRELIHSPQFELSSFDCDPDAARRFLPQ